MTRARRQRMLQNSNAMNLCILIHDDSPLSWAPKSTRALRVFGCCLSRWAQISCWKMCTQTSAARRIRRRIINVLRVPITIALLPYSKRWMVNSGRRWAPPSTNVCRVGERVVNSQIFDVRKMRSFVIHNFIQYNTYKTSEKLSTHTKHQNHKLYFIYKRVDYHVNYMTQDTCCSHRHYKFD